MDMSIFKRQLWLCIGIAAAVCLLVFGLYYWTFPPTDWSVLLEKKIYDIPFLLFVPVMSLMIGILSGIGSGLFYKSELSQLESTLRNVSVGDPISEGKIIKIKDFQDSLSKIKTIQTNMLNQAKRSQTLATEKAEEQEKRIQEMVMQERNRLARELHDSVSQQLFAASMLMSAINESGTFSDLPEQKQLQLIEDMIQQSQLEMRALLLHLRPVQLKNKSLKEGVDELLRELRQKVPFEVNWKVDDLTLEKGIEDHLFRILQESVSNTLRHAKAHMMEVYIIKYEHGVLMRIIDDGVGFAPDETKTGSYGLQNMRERAIEIGGTMKIVSVPNQGTRIEVRVPLMDVGEQND